MKKKLLTVGFGFLTIMALAQVAVTVPNRSAAAQSIFATISTNTGFRMGWLRLGPGISIVENELRITSPEVRVPRMVRQEINLSSVTTEQRNLTRTLINSPAPGTLIHVVFQSSLVGHDFNDYFVPDNVNPREITFQLPEYRPFTNLDKVVLVFWTLE